MCVCECVCVCVCVCVCETVCVCACIHVYTELKQYSAPSITEHHQSCAVATQYDFEIIQVSTVVVHAVCSGLTMALYCQVVVLC